MEDVLSPLVDGVVALLCEEVQWDHLEVWEACPSEEEAANLVVLLVAI